MVFSGKILLDQIDAFAFGNPRTMTPAQQAALRESVTRLGFIEPIIVRARNDRFELLNGHHRVALLREMHASEIDAVAVDVPDDVAARIAAVALNKISATYDLDQLAAYMDQLIADTQDDPTFLTACGLSDAELTALSAIADPAVAVDTGSPASPDTTAPTITSTRQTLAMPLRGEDAAIAEAAIAQAKQHAGVRTRVAALVHICRSYLATVKDTR